MKRYLSIILLATCLIMTGCKHEPEEVATVKFDIPLSGNMYCSLDIPDTWVLTEQNGLNYWCFNDLVNIYKSETQFDVGAKDGQTTYSTYSVSRDFDDGTSVIISVDKAQLDTAGELLDNAEVKECSVMQYKELGLNSIPEYAQQEMVITENGLYMPVGYDYVTSNRFTGSHLMSGTDYITSWIMKYKLIDLKPFLHNVLMCNSPDSGISKWYESDDIYIAWSGNNVVAAKKLTYNLWYCYTATANTYNDYVIQAMLNVDYK